MSLFDEPRIEPAPKQHRWHCSKCGRWVPFPTVRKIEPSGPDWVDEHGHVGRCRIHGLVDVTWPEAGV